MWRHPTLSKEPITSLPILCLYYIILILYCQVLL
nr:MAG TPA: hypothetical protein [Caudoviricetes sp.]